MITIIDYGMGNIGSIVNMLRKIGADFGVSSDPDEIHKANKIIIPGVGSFDNGMIRLNELKLIDVLNQKVVEQKTPVLGICLGMHLLTNKSEEGFLDGLGWIDAETIKFNSSNNNKIKIPHMGWNTVNIMKGSSPLFRNMYENAKFYFVHSYYVKCNNVTNVLTETEYGTDFASSIEKDHIFGVQFHPEKSHKYGMLLLKNFMEL